MRAARICRRVRRWLLPGFALVLTLSALPGGARMADRGAWKTPLAVRQLKGWSDALSYVGVELSPRELDRLTWRAARGYLALRRALLRPLRGVLEQVGLEQSWALFAMPQTDPCRLLIEIETEHGWQTVYASRSDTHEWHRELFDQHRIRKVIGRLARTESSKARWNALTTWISRRVWRELPEARSLRISLWRWHTPAPGSEGAIPALSERGSLAQSAVLRRPEGS